MGKKVGTIQDPQFVTELGHTLKINPIGPLVVKRWESEYKKAHPEPEPPAQTLENGQEVQNRKHPDYVKALAVWVEDFNTALVKFALEWGIKSQPPEDWQYPYPMEVNGDDPKYLWLETLLMPNDIEELTEAVFSITGATEAGIEEAQKNSTSVTGDETSGATT